MRKRTTYPTVELKNIQGLAGPMGVSGVSTLDRAGANICRRCGHELAAHEVASGTCWHVVGDSPKVKLCNCAGYTRDDL